MKKPFLRTGDVLRGLRIKNGYTQAELGALIGMHSQYVSNVERNMCFYPKHSLKKLAKFLNLSKQEKELIIKFMVRDQETKIRLEVESQWK